MAQLKSQLFDKLIEANPMDIPAALIEQELPRLRQEAAARMNMGNMDADKLAQLLPDNLFEQTANRRVALGLLVSEVIKAQEIKLDPERVEKALDNIAADYEEPEQVKTFYRSRPDMMQGLSAMVLEEQVVDTDLGQADVTDKAQSLDELLKPQQQAA